MIEKSSNNVYIIQGLNSIQHNEKNTQKFQ